MGTKSSTDDVLGSDTVKKIRKVHGKSILTRASESPLRSGRIPTGAFMLDYALGGGFPVGYFNVVWGPKSAMKTSIYLKAIANAQNMCANCWQMAPCSCGAFRDPSVAFLDVEGTLDLKWASRLGVDLERMMHSTPDYAEQALDMGEALVREGIDILVLDSIAFLTPAKEIKDSVGQDNVALQARAMGKGIRKFVSAINSRANEFGHRPTILATNQVRMKVGVMFGSPETQPGGMAHGFAAGTETKMRPGKFDMDEVTGKPLSAEFSFRVEKNKTALPKIEGTFKLVLANTETRRVGDIMNEGTMVSLGEKVGLVEGHGPKWTCLGQSFKGKSLVERELLVNPEFYSKLHDALMVTLLSVE